MATDRFVHAPGGRLFVRVWGTIGSPAGQPAIILFHDSLGCVELWRDFPLQLASTTGLPVVAYDRLGFGGSDPHPSRLNFGFVEDEARTAVPELRSALSALPPTPTQSVILEDCGHVPHREKLDQVLGAVNQFLGGVDPGFRSK